MRRSFINPNLAYAIFALAMVVGIGAFAAFAIFAPQPDGSALVAAKTTPGQKTIEVPDGVGADAGQALFQVLGCTSCHIGAGISGGGNVGPNLSRMGSQAQIAGVVPNTPENMVKWLMDPQAIKPGTQMPNLGLTELQATALTAYLEESK